MMRFIALVRPVCSASIALLALGAAPAPAGAIPLPVPDALGGLTDALERSVEVHADGAEANGRSRRSPGAPYVKVDRPAVRGGSLLARPLVMESEARIASRIARLAGTGATLAGRPRLSPDRGSFTLKVLDRQVWISRVAVTRQRLEIVFTTRF
jgi:hypothetical protein